jgi:hypothetical protein
MRGKFNEYSRSYRQISVRVLHSDHGQDRPCRFRVVPRERKSSQEALPSILSFKHYRNNSASRMKAIQGDLKSRPTKCRLAEMAGDFRSNRLGSTGLALMPASMQTCDQFLKALFRGFGLRRTDIRRRSTSPDEVQVCANGVCRLRPVNGYVPK